MFRSALLLGFSLVIVGACGAQQPTLPPPTATPQPTPSATSAPSLTPSPSPTSTPTPTPTPTPPATPAPTLPPIATPDASFPAGSVIVTFDVEDEEFRVLLTEPDDIDIARALLDGEEAPPIPNGRVLPGDGGVNGPWSWHLDPADIEFADLTTEVCDGLPSFVENHQISGDRYCPWSAEVVSIDPAGG